MAEFTKGKLEAIGSSKSKFKDAYFIRLKNKENSFIAKTYGHTGFPAEANAQELVRRWNSHEDLLAACKLAIPLIAGERITYDAFPPKDELAMTLVSDIKECEKALEAAISQAKD